jgi:crotonobetainyl-CoA:carnitine CoA-transferase CaiB-like acyl-CoA transferase
VRAFLTATDRNDLFADPRFSTVAARAKFNNDWFAVRGAPLPNKTTAEWLTIFQAADIAAMPCHTLETLRHDPHLEAVGLVRFEEHPTEGRAAAIRSTIRIDGEFPDLRSPAQPHGAQTQSILTELGFAPADIARLLESGVAQVAAQSKNSG